MSPPHWPLRGVAWNRLAPLARNRLRASLVTWWAPGVHQAEWAVHGERGVVRGRRAGAGSGGGACCRGAPHVLRRQGWGRLRRGAQVVNPHVVRQSPLASRTARRGSTSVLRPRRLDRRSSLKVFGNDGQCQIDDQVPESWPCAEFMVGFGDAVRFRAGGHIRKSRSVPEWRSCSEIVAMCGNHGQVPRFLVSLGVDSPCWLVPNIVVRQGVRCSR